MFVSLPLALLAFQGLVPPPKPAPDAVVATVGGEPITAAEIEPYLWAWKAREVANDLAAHRMIAAEAKRKGIVVTDAEVKARIDQQLASAKGQLAPGQTIEDFVAKQPGGMSRLALVARSQVIIDKLAEAEFKPDGFVKVVYLSFPTNGDTTDVLAKAIKAADAAYASLQAGKAWDVVAKAAAPAGTASREGWLRVEVLPESVQKQLAAAKPMGITKPVQTPYGIQVFRLLARGSAATPTEAVDLKAQYLASARQGIVTRLRQSAKVEYKGP